MYNDIINILNLNYLNNRIEELDVVWVDNKLDIYIQLAD